MRPRPHRRRLSLRGRLGRRGGETLVKLGVGRDQELSLGAETSHLKTGCYGFVNGMQHGVKQRYRRSCSTPAGHAGRPACAFR